MELEVGGSVLRREAAEADAPVCVAAKYYEDPLRTLAVGLDTPVPAEAAARAVYIRTTNNQLEESRMMLQGRLFPIINGNLHYLRVPADVEQSLQLVTTPNRTDRHPMPVQNALLLGVLIAQHRAIASEQRSLIGIRTLTEAQAKRLTALESDRRALVERYLGTSDRTLNRRMTLQSLLVRCENLGLPTELLDERHIARLQRTRQWLQTHMDDRESLRRHARNIYRDLNVNRTVINPTTMRDFGGEVNRIASNVPGGGFIYNDETKELDAIRILDLLGFVSHQWPTTREFNAAEQQSLTTIRAWLQSERGATLRGRLYTEMQGLRSLEGTPNQSDVQRADLMGRIRVVLRHILREGGGGVVLEENATEDHVISVLEMLDVTDSPFFHNRLTNNHVQELVRARRQNLQMLQDYLADWQGQVSSGRVAMDGRAILQHVLTMRFLGSHAVLSMNVPQEFQNLVDERQRPASLNLLLFNLSLQPAFDFHDAVMPTGVLGRFGVPGGYRANEARTEGLNIFGWQAIMQMPNPYTLLEGALIPPPDVVIGDAASIAVWRQRTIEELRGMNDATRTQWLQNHFQQATVERSVIAITRLHEGRVNPSILRLSATLETLEALAGSEQSWRPEDLALVTQQGQRPGWWQEPPEGDAVTAAQLTTWRTNIVQNMRKVPSNDPNFAQKQREAKWIYERLLVLMEEQTRVLEERKRAYMNALSTNFSTHISNAALNFSQGDQRVNDAMIAGMIAGEGYLTYRYARSYLRGTG